MQVSLSFWSLMRKREWNIVTFSIDYSQSTVAWFRELALQSKDPLQR